MSAKGRPHCTVVAKTYPFESWRFRPGCHYLGLADGSRHTSVSTFAVIAERRLITASSDIVIARKYKERGENRTILMLDRNGRRVELDGKGGTKVYISGIEVP